MGLPCITADAPLDLPLVDESDKLDIAAAEDRFTDLRHALPGLGVAWRMAK